MENINHTSPFELPSDQDGGSKKKRGKSTKTAKTTAGKV